MAISAMTLAVALTLKDQFSSPLRGATAAVDRLGGAMQRAALPGSALSARLQSVAMAAKAVGDRMSMVGQRLALFGGAVELAAGVGLKSYIASSIEAEHRLRALGNTAGLSTPQLAAIDQRLNAMARATNQFKLELLGANEALMAAGMDWRTALDITPVLGKTATASQALMGDLAKIAVRAQQNMGVPIAQMQDLFDRLTVAGESGMFELKAMAQYLPALTASMGALKFTGIENIDRLGAALQIAFMGAGEAGVAANNLQNFLDKLAAPVTLKNFKDAGINLEQVLVDARAKGLDPLLVTMEQIQKATGGNEFKIGELFGDQQVLAYIKPMLANLERYRQILGGMGDAAGKSAKNFDAMMTTTQERWKAFVIKMQTTPMPWLDKLIARISKALDWANQNPEWADRIVTGLMAITAAGLGLAVVGPVVSSLATGLGGLVGLMSRAAPLAAGMAAGSAGVAGAAGAAGAGAAAAGASRLGPLMMAVPAVAPAAPKLTAGAIAVNAVAIVGAGALGTAIGTVLYEKWVAGTNLADSIGRAIAQVMAGVFGSKDAQQALDSEQKAGGFDAPTPSWWQRKTPERKAAAAEARRRAAQQYWYDSGEATMPGAGWGRNWRAAWTPGKSVQLAPGVVPSAPAVKPITPTSPGSLSLGPPIQTLTSAADTSRQAAETFGRSADVSSQAAGSMDQAGTKQITAAGSMDQAGVKQIAAAGAFQAAAERAATALGTPITGLIQIQVTGPAQVKSVTKTSGAVDLSATETGGLAAGL